MKIAYVIRNTASQLIFGLPYDDFKTLQISGCIAARELARPSVQRWQQWNAKHHAKRFSETVKRNFPNLGSIYFDNPNY